ncbi:MazG nucleotide pyrophosphohydrolase domain-containing protein [Thalassotalea eurytherma]|uniref:NTP pyrophosphohydrolase MazG-like domain-containing protein n=1 Tax=Thalassotalea eurytherma TaxID=1144278 RepID=A0ABQ6H526_9GAMM|nr:MazG nucleotide pyrophosphohydrolase domain-containing protein [Thalassotalea eurytherma]GLX83263.1 hypothetical protein theurythT_27150 [Thalassotalea eurytherma]
MENSINEIARQNFQWVEEMGWHNKTVLEALALVASEVGEAINECRQQEPSPEFAEELADIVLRVLDIAHWQGIDMEKTILEKMEKNQSRGARGRVK